MRILAILAPLALAAALVGCSSQTSTAPLVMRTTARASVASACGPSARAAEPAYALAVADPVGVSYTTGPAQSARAALQVPGSIVECGGVALGEGAGVIGRFLKCVGGHLTDPLDPPPSVRYVYGGLPGASASDCCGGNCAPPAGPRLPPPPPPPPLPDGDVPESIPAIRR